MSSIFLKKWEKKKNKGKDSAKKRLGDLFSSERWQAPETFCGGIESIEVKNLIQVCNNDYFTCGLGDVRLVCSELSHSLAVVLWWGNLIVSGTEEGRWILYQVPVENLELMSGTEKVLLKDEKRNCPLTVVMSCLLYHNQQVSTTHKMTAKDHNIFCPVKFPTEVLSSWTLKVSYYAHFQSIFGVY